MTPADKAGDLAAVQPLEAAQREESGEPPVYEYGGKRYTLPVSMPLGFSFHQLEAVEANERSEAAEKEGRTEDKAAADRQSAMATMKALQSLLGSRFDEYLASGAGTDDAARLFREAMAAYGISEGESSASPTPSGTTGARSRPTSKPTTE